MKLLRNLVLLKLEEAEETWGEGIIVKTDEAKTPAPKGTVTNIGPEVTEVRVGDTVIFGKYAGQEVESEVLICESDILAIEET